ncbi:MAG: hypothetical protein IJC74_08775 [Clostridia bacterium]|nr:hypothetical protein [Clostridia bacterium]
MKKNGDKSDILLESERIVNEYAKKLFQIKKAENSLSKLPLYMLIPGVGLLGAGVFAVFKFFM